MVHPRLRDGHDIILSHPVTFLLTLNSSQHSLTNTSPLLSPVTRTPPPSDGQHPCRQQLHIPRNTPRPSRNLMCNRHPLPRHSSPIPAARPRSTRRGVCLPARCRSGGDTRFRFRRRREEKNRHWRETQTVGRTHRTPAAAGKVERDGVEVYNGAHYCPIAASQVPRFTDLLRICWE